MIELNIIKHLLNKKIYDKYFLLIKAPEELKKHYMVLEDVHSSTEGDITLDEYLLHAEQAGCKYLDVLKDAEVGHESMDKLIKTLVERTWAHRLAILSVDVSEGRQPLSALTEHYAKLEHIHDDVQEEEEFVTDDVEELWENVRMDGGMKWRLPWLNHSLGGLRDGMFGFVFARTNTGKTTFLCSEVSHMLTQSTRPVLWINNEEPGSRIKFRMLQSYFGIDEDTLNENRKGWMEKFLTETEGRFKLKDLGVVHKRDVDRLVAMLKPSLLIIDNIDKIHGFKGDRQDLVLGQIYIWGREIAKTYCPVIGVSQANGNAENKKWLTHNEIESAHTAKSKDADFIIGIGMTYDIGAEDIRYLRLVKNKFKGGEHRTECRIDFKTGRYNPL